MNRAAQITELKSVSMSSSSDEMITEQVMMMTTMDEKALSLGKRTRTSLPAVVSPRPKIRARRSPDMEDEDGFFLLSPLEAGFQPVSKSADWTKKSSSDHKVEYIGYSDMQPSSLPSVTMIEDLSFSEDDNEDDDEEELSMIHKVAASNERKLPSLRPKPNLGFFHLEEELLAEEDFFPFTPDHSSRRPSTNGLCNDDGFWA